MDFREATLNDMASFDQYKNICSDYLLSYLFMYQDLYKLKMAENDGNIIIRSDMAAT
ncbi:MAG: hypothetical protein K0Q65_1496, partial [Clostridia bacterium]|nr:hypothetical protein [Clostridia bacterium]